MAGVGRFVLIATAAWLIMALRTAAAEGELVNPHWQAGECQACHQGEPSASTLRSEGDINALCGSCHETDLVEAYIHAVGMEPPKPFLERMPEAFSSAVARGGGKVTCIACHDLPMQCKEERRGEQERNPRFFREGPYRSRTELCFKCHDAEEYTRHNPHDQISESGELNSEQCFYCHNATPDRENASSIDDVTFSIEEDLSQLCTRCHIWSPHPVGAEHLVVPTLQTKRRMRRRSKAAGAMMPLDPNSGKIICATCHNPHERGVQLYDRAGNGADAPQRLRMEGMVICLSCHDK